MAATPGRPAMRRPGRSRHSPRAPPGAPSPPARRRRRGPRRRPGGGRFLWSGIDGPGPPPRLTVTSAVVSQGDDVASGYLTVRNDGGADALVGVPADVAGTIERTVQGSRRVGRHGGSRPLADPRWRHAAARPGGAHLMLEPLRRPLVPGEQVTLTLQFSPFPPVDGDGYRGVVLGDRPREMGDGAMTFDERWPLMRCWCSAHKRALVVGLAAVLRRLGAVPGAGRLPPCASSAAGRPLRSRAPPGEWPSSAACHALARFGLAASGCSARATSRRSTWSST